VRLVHAFRGLPDLHVTCTFQVEAESDWQKTLPGAGKHQGQGQDQKKGDVGVVSKALGMLQAEIRVA
jgi:hypothetical protein